MIVYDLLIHHDNWHVRINGLLLAVRIDSLRFDLNQREFIKYQKADLNCDCWEWSPSHVFKSPMTLWLMSYQQLDLFVHDSTWRSKAQQGWKWAWIKLGNTSEGREIMKGEGLGRDYCIRGVMRHPWTKLLNSGPFNREGWLNRAVAEAGPGSMCVWTHWQVFKASRLLEHTEFLRGRTAEPGSPWERLTQRRGSLRQN